MAVLKVENLHVVFETRNGVSKAVNDVSFNVEEGRTLAIVGESGSGKSVSCYALLGLIPSPPGRVSQGKAIFDNKDLLQCSEKELSHIRGKDIAMIFQDPMTALNPFLRVGEQLIEPLVYHEKLSKKEAKREAVQLLVEVGIQHAEKAFDQWPHEFSGGMRQRVVIAMALIAKPKLLIADEPTTALDVTIQKQILELVHKIQKQRNIGMIFISHDLGVVKRLADHIIVMKAGNIVESGNSDAIFNHAKHEYTQKLLSAIPHSAKAQPQENGAPTLLSVDNVSISYGTGASKKIAVDDVSFTIKRGEILGVVGESGSGKSTIGKAIMGMVACDSGAIQFDGSAIHNLSSKAMLPYRKKIQMIFQDPYGSLNPRLTVFDTLAEPLLLHGISNKAQLKDDVFRLMDEVGLPKSAIKKYPHEFSGGQRQRIAIGRAVAVAPELIIADEPVSALDVTIQQQILQLMLQLASERDLSFLFVSHDLAVVRVMCDRVVVMQHGKQMEAGITEEVWQSPSSAYTQQLLSAIPS